MAAMLIGAIVTKITTARCRNEIKYFSKTRQVLSQRATSCCNLQTKRTNGTKCHDQAAFYTEGPPRARPVA